MTGSSFDLLNGGDPGVATFFLFTIDGIEVGVFKEVRGLEFTMSTVDAPEGGQNSFTRKLPGRTSWANVVLKRGLTHTDVLSSWLTQYSNSRYRAQGAGDGATTKRATGAITALTETRQHLRAWKLQDIMPVRWKGPEFSIESRSALEEELEIAHHGLSVETFDPSSNQGQ